MQGIINCECGVAVPFDGYDDTVECDCGRTYAVTISELSIINKWS